MPRGTQTFRNTRVEMIEDKEVCPYNKSHLIRPERMQRHLILCRKDVISKPTHPFHREALQHEKCPFDANHHIPKMELASHVKSCPSRRQVAKAQLKDENTDVPAWRKAIPQSKAEQKILKSSHDWDEDWDAEAESAPVVGTYNPMNKIINSDNPILFNIQGKSKSEKRDFRARQRAKHIGGQEDAFEDWDDGPIEPVGLAKVKPAVKNNRTRQDWENEGNNSSSPGHRKPDNNGKKSGNLKESSLSPTRYCPNRASVSPGRGSPNPANSIPGANHPSSPIPRMSLGGSRGWGQSGHADNEIHQKIKCEDRFTDNENKGELDENRHSDDQIFFSDDEASPEMTPPDSKFIPQVEDFPGYPQADTEPTVYQPVRTGIGRGRGWNFPQSPDHNPELASFLPTGPNSPGLPVHIPGPPIHIPGPGLGRGQVRHLPPGFRPTLPTQMDDRQVFRMPDGHLVVKIGGEEQDRQLANNLADHFKEGPNLPRPMFQPVPGLIPGQGLVPTGYIRGERPMFPIPISSVGLHYPPTMPWPVRMPQPRPETLYAQGNQPPSSIPSELPIETSTDIKHHKETHFTLQQSQLNKNQGLETRGPPEPEKETELQLPLDAIPFDDEDFPALGASFGQMKIRR